jgi:hypothetical protein
LERLLIALLTAEMRPEVIPKPAMAMRVRRGNQRHPKHQK